MSTKEQKREWMRELHRVLSVADIGFSGLDKEFIFDEICDYHADYEKTPVDVSVKFFRAVMSENIKVFKASAKKGRKNFTTTKSSLNMVGVQDKQTL